MASFAAPPRDTVLKTARLVLRPTEAADAQRFFEIQSNWNVTRMLRLATWPASLAAMSAWVAQHSAEWTAGTGYRFAVMFEGRLVGCCDVDEIAEGGGALGYWLDEAVWGRGLAREAAGAVAGFAFDRLGLGRLTAGRAADNPASGRVLESLGFREIARGARASGPHGIDVPYVFYRLESP